MKLLNIKNWWNKLEQENRVSVAKETIIYSLFNELSTEQSVALFKEISEDFRDKMSNRLNNISSEKEILENFCKLEN